jgi:hypothetical protein
MRRVNGGQRGSCMPLSDAVWEQLMIFFAVTTPASRILFFTGCLLMAAMFLKLTTDQCWKRT